MGCRCIDPRGNEAAPKLRHPIFLRGKGRFCYAPYPSLQSASFEGLTSRVSYDTPASSKCNAQTVVARTVPTTSDTEWRCEREPPES